ELNDGARASIHADPLQSSPYLLSGNGVRVGMWDSGDIDASHPDLAGRIHIMETFGLSSHSTHVAGTLAGTRAARASHGGTPFQWKGMAPAAGIWDYTYFDDPVGEHNGAINGQGIDLSQNSWGYSISASEGSCGYYGDYVWDAPEYDGIVTGI